MTVVNLSIKRPQPNGTNLLVEGWLQWTPTMAQNLSPDLVLPVPFQIDLSATTPSEDVDIAPTGPGWAWKVDTHVTGYAVTSQYFAVPTMGPVAFADLVQVDPKTLEPTATPEAAWWAVANSNVVSGAVVGGNLVLTKYDGSTTNAGNVIGPPGIADDTSMATIASNPETEFAGVLNATVAHALPSAASPARKLAGKLNDRLTTSTVQRGRVVAFGDSIALNIWRNLYPLLNRAYGGVTPPGVTIGAGTSGTGWSTPGVGKVGDTGTITNQTAAFDIWPSGFADLYSTGATRKYGILGGSATWDIAKVYYAKEAGSGTFTVQVDGVDEPSATNVSAAGVGLGILTITRGTATARELKVVNLTGTHRIIGVGFEVSTAAGIVFANISQGGIALDTQTTQGYANFQTFLTDYAPDLITFEMKESSTYLATAMETLLTIIDGGAPAATFVGIGSTPLAVNDADQVVQNAQIRAACGAHGKVYWDGYTPFGSYAALNALGWAGDGIHVDVKASGFLSGLFARDLGLFNHAGAQMPFNVNAANVAISNQLILGSAKLNPAGLGMTFDMDNNFTITGPNGTMLRIPAGGSTAQAILPNTAQLGSGNTRLTADTNGITIKDPTGGPAANLYAKQLVALNNGLRATPVATTARPSGATVGDGTMMVDSTLNKPIWFVAGSWRDATGAVV